MQPSPKRRTGLQIQIAAVRALFWREVHTRFGTYDLRLGYFWVLLAPGMQVLFFLIVFSTIKIKVVPYMDFSLFLVSGILPWAVFASSAGRALGAVEANKGLFNYRPVMLIDTIIARTTLETLLSFNIFMIFLFFLWWFGKVISIEHVPLLVLSWGLLWLFSIAFALIMMVVGHWSAEVGRFIMIFIRILYFASGVMYSLHILPPEVLKYVLWNPIPHVLEHIRHAIAPAYPVDHVSFAYFLKSLIVMLFIGLLLYRGNERSMMTSKSR
ncbi:MAG: ABC transporter permease [Moraxellaceae bacterium]